MFFRNEALILIVLCVSKYFLSFQYMEEMKHIIFIVAHLVVPVLVILAIKEEHFPSIGKFERNNTLYIPEK